MLIVCPSCASEYRIPDTHLGKTGRMVRCASCRQTWFATSQEEEDLNVEAINSKAVTIPHDDVESYWERNAQETKPLSFKKRITAFMATFFRPFLRLSPAVPLSLIIVTLLGGGLIYRQAAVRTVPQLGGLYALIGLDVNLVGLDFRNIQSQIVLKGEDTVLVVEGEIANVSGHEAKVPSISIGLKGANSQTLYEWVIEPPRQQIAEKETAKFRARLSAPPPEAQQVLVRFVNEQGAKLAAR
jgi:predicted Zn finger-like uncharacterized protein